ncbi:MAG: helix-turn-helix domain-containing protein [Chloroflexaceae bacterium]|jgi:transcriptional regulator with XRE-family HTH domain|nr:helix-turn-helix domain-containing protein [Chloroflexaceae bacterium]
MPQSLNERIGDVIKRKRQKYRYTQSDLGAKIGVSGSYISSIESGTTGVRITELEGLAVAFQTTAVDLITEAAGKDEYRFTASNRERDAFLTIYDGLTPEHQKQARNFLLFLRQQQDTVE